MKRIIGRLCAIFAFSTTILLTAAPYGSAQGERWKSSEIIRPERLVKLISAKSKAHPLVLQVGFGFLYEGGHIDGSVWAGPASRADGIERLERVVKDVSKNREIVLYCGCCPWTECPNVGPAFDTMRRLGFKDVKVLYIPTNFEQDWIRKGYPTAKSGRPASR